MSTRFSGGGGVVAEFFPNLKNPEIQWGGVVAEIFRDLKNPMRFSGGGGVVAEFFLVFYFPEGGPWAPPESATACHNCHDIK